MFGLASPRVKQPLFGAGFGVEGGADEAPDVPDAPDPDVPPDADGFADVRAPGAGPT